MRNSDDSFHDHTPMAIDKGEVDEKIAMEAFDSFALTDTRFNLYQNYATRVKCIFWHYPCFLEIKKSDFNNDGSVFEGILNIRFYLKRCQYEGGKICSRI